MTEDIPGNDHVGQTRVEIGRVSGIRDKFQRGLQSLERLRPVRTGAGLGFQQSHRYSCLQSRAEVNVDVLSTPGCWRRAIRPRPAIRTAHRGTGEAGAEVAPRDEALVGISNRRTWRQLRSDVDPRPERLKKFFQRRFETPRVGDSAQLLHSMDGKAVPVEAGRGGARIEVANDTEQSGERSDVLDFLRRAARRRNG